MSTFERREAPVNEESQTSGSGVDYQTDGKQPKVYDNRDQGASGTDQGEELLATVASQGQYHMGGERESGGREPPLTELSRNSSKPVGTTTASSRKETPQGKSNQSSRATTQVRTSAGRNLAAGG